MGIPERLDGFAKALTDLAHDPAWNMHVVGITISTTAARHDELTQSIENREIYIVAEFKVRKEFQFKILNELAKAGPNSEDEAKTLRFMET
jgi:hypothetical protein